jgi:hypothetical protein
MLRIEGIVSGTDTKTKDDKTTHMALITDGMESYKISSVKPLNIEKGKQVSVPVRANEYKGVIYYQVIS